MANEKSKPTNAPALSSSKLGDMVLDHLLNDLPLFLGGKHKNQVAQLEDMMDSLNELVHHVATMAIANRANLSNLPTLKGSICADPEQNPADNKLYELRYRMTEQTGNNAPHKDTLLTLDEAVEIFGQSYVDDYWGVLGDKCPQRIDMANGTVRWFTTVRFPVLDSTLSASTKKTADPTPR